MRALVGLLLVTLGVVVPVPPAGAGSAGDLVVVLPSPRSLFSPNGDGRRDTLPVRFRLAERAHVTVRRAAGDTVVDLGVLPAGTHRWLWNGRGAPNGSFRLVVRAEAADGRTGRDTRSGALDRGEALRAVEITMTRRTLYPRTPDKRDAIYAHSTKEGNATRVTLLDQRGRVALTDRFWTWWTWTGEGDDGTLLAPGEYAAVFAVNDRFGNRREIRRDIEVSTTQLQQQTWSSTVAAGEAGQFRAGSECRTTPSARFPAGVTVASAGCERAWFLPRLDLPVPIDPDLRWRLTITGGPTVPGTPDTASVVLRNGIDTAIVVTAAGDTTTATPWGGPHAYEWAREPESFGGVSTQDGASYDVAEVTLEVRYWTPSPQRPPSRR